MKRNNARGLIRFRLAAQWSWNGLRQAYAHEAAFRQELLVSVFLVPLGLWLGKTPVEKICLACSLFLILTVEPMNISIETDVDRTGLEHHPLAGRAKDMGSAAVLLLLLNALFTWTYILIF